MDEFQNFLNCSRSTGLLQGCFHKKETKFPVACVVHQSFVTTARGIAGIITFHFSEPCYNLPPPALWGQTVSDDYSPAFCPPPPGA